MSKNCAVCGDAVRTKTSGTICDGDCGKWYHYKCHNTSEKATTVPRADGKQWKCARCVNDRAPPPPLSRLNFNLGGTAAGGIITRSADTTPLGSPSATGAFSIAVDVGNSLSRLQQDVQKILEGQASIELNLRKIKDTQNDMQKSVDFFMEKIHDFEARFKEQDEKIAEHYGTLQNLTPEVQKLRKEVSQLQAQREDAEQRAIADVVEIKGVPDSVTNLVETVIDIATAVECTVHSVDILQVRRAQSKKQVGKDNSKEQGNPIHVQFVKKDTRDAFIKAVRAKRRLCGRDIGIHSAGEHQVYVNELLTNRRKLLLSTAKTFAKTHNIKYVWARSGQVLMRKNSGDKAYVIKQETDLDAFFL